MTALRVGKNLRCLSIPFLLSLLLMLIKIKVRHKTFDSIYVNISNISFKFIHDCQLLNSSEPSSTLEELVLKSTHSSFFFFYLLPECPQTK